MSRNYKFLDLSGKYFVSFAVVYWLDVFIRNEYINCIVENLNYCVKNKDVVIYSWCLMPSHIHLVFESKANDPAGFLRDFKSFTSKKLIEIVNVNPQESRKEWLLNAFQKAAKVKSNNTLNQFWQQHNKPIELWSNQVIEQKIDYIHNNPVESGFVDEPWKWKNSSAIDYSGGNGLVKVVILV